ncbi:DNRLRE domain-containing protein, partial [Rubripirellula amarantea]|nr:DNRLRE domain-containing protein [Rubripirellula amarantea]
PDRVASNPVVQTAKRPVQKSQPINIIAMRSMKLLPVSAASSEVTSGDAARFKIPIANEAGDASVDPKTIYASTGYVGKLVTKIKRKSGGSFTSPTFPKRFSAKQLPDRGQTDEIEVQFLTSNLTAGEYDVRFEFQTPGNQKFSEVSSGLTVKENLAHSDLLGFEILRTHVGEGADTYLHSDWNSPMESKREIELLRKGMDGYTKEEHAYLRFDLSKSKVDVAKLDRAILMLTVSGESNTSNVVVQAYGIKNPERMNWDPSDPGSFTWENSPSAMGITNEVFLGQVTIHNHDETLKYQGDQVRIYSEALDDFLRASQGNPVTVVLVSETWIDKPIRFRSKDGKLDQAPALALRAKP